MTFLGLGVSDWVFVALAPLCVLAERLAPRVPERLISAGNGRRVLYLALRAGVGAIAALVLVTVMRRWPPGWGLEAAGVSFAAQCAIVLVVVDFKAYWIHRAQHWSPWMWRLHKVHHSATSLNWLASSQTHMLDALVVQLGTSIVVVWLLGAEPAAYLVGAAVPTMVFSALGAHLNVDFPRGPLPWWARIVNTPNVHALHHARRAQSPNFAEVFVLWDVLFGTFETPRGAPRELGLIDEPDFPVGVLAAHLSPFRRAPRPRSNE